MKDRNQDRLRLDTYYTPPEDALRLVGVLANVGAIKPGHTVLEGHAGAGAWLTAIESHFGTDVVLQAIDLDPWADALCSKLDVHISEFEAADFLYVEVASVERIVVPVLHRDKPYADEWNRPNVVLGNPPYGAAHFVDCKKCAGTGKVDVSSCTAKGCVDGQVRAKKDKPVAELHIRKALDVSTRHVVFLLRQGIMATKKRVEGLWEDHPPRHFWTLGWRPSFMAHVGAKGGDRYDYVMVWWDKEWPGPTTWSPLSKIQNEDKIGKPLLDILDLDDPHCTGVMDNRHEAFSCHRKPDHAGRCCFGGTGTAGGKEPHRAGCPALPVVYAVDLNSFRSSDAGPEFVIDLLSFAEEP